MKYLKEVVAIAILMVGIFAGVGIASTGAASADVSVRAVRVPTDTVSNNGPPCTGANDGQRVVDIGGTTWECDGNSGLWRQVQIT